MDVSDASYYIQENNENKGSRMGHTKKIFKKKKKRIWPKQCFNFHISHFHTYSNFQIPNYLFQIRKLHMVLFKLEIIQK